MYFQTTLRYAALFIIFCLTLGLIGCGSLGGASSSEVASETKQSAPEPAEVPSEEEMETPLLDIPENSPLAKIEQGMSDGRVRGLIGGPAETRNYVTGKAWIPFYYGPDTSRTEWIYPEEGRITFSRNRYSGELKVINVIYNPEQM